MMSKSIHMETTTIAATKTIAEIQNWLMDIHSIKAFQAKVEDGQVVAVAFIMEVCGERVPFQLPAKTEAVFEYLQRKRSSRMRSKPLAVKKDREQALKVAWRQVLRWVQAQVSMISIGQIEAAEAFMPYAMISEDCTVYDRWLAVLASGGKTLSLETRGDR